MLMTSRRGVNASFATSGIRVVKFLFHVIVAGFTYSSQIIYNILHELDVIHRWAFSIAYRIRNILFSAVHVIKFLVRNHNVLL